MKTKRRNQKVDAVLLPCSGCKAKVSFANPETTKEPTFFHPWPYCKRFDSVNTTAELLVYMRECREKSELN